MLLEGRNAVIYGAAGAIGSTVARTFAGEGARLFLAGRTLAPLEVLAKEITAGGGQAEAAQVDALDGGAVDRHTGDIIAHAGSIDVSFNAVGIDHVQGVPLTELSVEDFSLPLTTYPLTQFLTSRATARYMIAQRSGVILTLSTTASRVALPSNGFGLACAAVEALSRQLAGELGPHGVRVNCLRPDAIPESAERGSHVRRMWRCAAERAGVPPEEAAPGVPGALLQRAPTLADVAGAATFLASDLASGMTGTITTVSCGSVID